MKMRRRFKQSAPLEERLAEYSKTLHEQAQSLPPGPVRDAMILKAQQAEAGAKINEWLRSPALPPPKAGTRLVQDIVRSRLKSSAER